MAKFTANVKSKKVKSGTVHHQLRSAVPNPPQSLIPRPSRLLAPLPRLVCSFSQLSWHRSARPPPPPRPRGQASESSDAEPNVVTTPIFSHPCPRRRCATLTLSLLPLRSPRRRTTAARPRRHGSRHRHRASPTPRTLPQNPTTRLQALMPPLPAEMTPTLTTAGLRLIGYVPTALVFQFL